MAVGALSERLALLVDLNPESAVHGLKKIGDTADKELGRTQDHLDRLGGKLQTAGVGMVAFGATALFTLGHFAKAAEEAELADLKLQNSIANAPQITDKSSQAFDDLATSLMKTTVFDDEATKGMEAYLIQVGLTKDQVLGLTPAIQDLAAKGDIPLEDAAKKVVMALNGKKKGLEALLGPLDAAKYATDRYGAVTEALGRVAGFAGAQGKTFEGQLIILQNELGELEEGVGMGVVKAFENMFHVVESVIGVLDDLNPGTQQGIGEWGAYASAGLVAAGALSLVAGTLVKARTNIVAFIEMLHLKTVAEKEDTAATEADAAANEAASMSMIPVVAGIAAIAAAAYIGYQNAEHFSLSLKGVTDEQLDQHLKDIAAAANLTGTSMYDVAKSLPIDEANRLADSLDRNGQSSADVRRAIADMTQAEIEAKAKTDGLTVAQEQAKISSDEYAASIKEVHDALHASIDPAFAYEQALIENRKAQADATAAAHDSSKSADEVQQANIRAAESAIKVKDAQVDLSAAMKDNPELAGEVIATLHGLADQGYLTTEQVDGLAYSIGALPTDTQLSIVADTSQAEAAIARLALDEQNALTFGARLAGLHFADGGMVPGPRGAPQLAVVHGGEYVWTADEVDAANQELVSAIPAPPSGAAGIGGGETHNHFSFTFTGPVLAEERYVIGVIEQAMSKGFSFGPATKRVIQNV